MGVKYGLNTTGSAPSLSGQAGALIALLDAYLVDGFLGYTPPVGWQKVFAGTNKAVYRSTALGSSGMYLRVDDTTTTYATVTGYESMTDVDTGTNAWGTVYWRKSSTGDTVTRKYLFACDEIFFVLSVGWYAGTPDYAGTVAFGDFISDISADGYNCWLSGDTFTNATSVQASNNLGYSSAMGSTQAGQFLARSFSGSVGGVLVGKPGFGPVAAFGSVGFANNPSLANGDRFVSPVKIAEVSEFRGTLPGIFQPLHTNSGSAWSLFSGVAGLSDRTWINIQTGSSGYNKIWIDVTGPWR